MVNLDLFPPPPPSGPEGRIPSRPEGEYHSYLVWKQSPDGHRACAWILDRVMARLRAGEQRISTRTILCECRDALKVEINNIYSPWIADDLIVRYPELLDVIERRKRRKAKR